MMSGHKCHRLMGEGVSHDFSGKLPGQLMKIFILKRCPIIKNHFFERGSINEYSGPSGY